MGSDISVVIPGRNDGHGGNFLDRLKHSIRNLFQTTDRHDIDLEVLLIESNPPQDRPSFTEALDWEQYPNAADVRIIEIPPAVHDRVADHDIPLYEGLTKNVGIRRATGDFVLTINADIIFSDELLQRFAATDLDVDSFYRADRHDLRTEIPPDAGVDESLCICRDNTAVVKTNHGNLRVNEGNDVISTQVRHLKRMLHNRAIQYKADPVALLRDLDIVESTPYRTVYDLHYLVSGDFFMTSQEGWEQMQGHPELQTFWHMDTYTCIEAAAVGLEQQLFDEPVYHQKHAESDHSSRPHTAWQQVVEDSKEMLSSRSPSITNDSEWGLKNEDLPETHVIHPSE